LEEIFNPGSTGYSKEKQMKTEIIEAILPLLRLPPHEHSKMRAELGTHTLVELKAFLGVVSSSGYQAELAEEEILRVQAERNADRILFQIQRQQATEPQRRAQAAQQLAKDKETFAALCRQHGLSACEANLNLWRSTNSISGLAVASPEEMEAYRQEAVEKRQDFLLNTDPTTLRSEGRRESVERQTAVVQDQAGRELEAARQSDQYRGYRPLPPEIDSKAIKAASAVQLKQMMRLYGDFQITTRLRESAAASSAQEN